MTCSAAECTRTNLIARGMCWAHYQRWRRNIPVDGPIRTYKRKVAA